MNASRRQMAAELCSAPAGQMTDSSKPIKVELGIEFVVELLLFLYPYGAEQMDLPHNFWLGLACWVVGTAIAIRMFWIFPVWSNRLSRLEKGLIAFILTAGLASVFHKPVMIAYGKRNGETAVSPREQPAGSAPGKAAPVTGVELSSPSDQTPNVGRVENRNQTPSSPPRREARERPKTARPSEPPKPNDSTTVGGVTLAPGSIPPGSVFSIGQQGGITAGTVTIGSEPHLAMSDDQQNMITSKLRPMSGRTVGIFINGNAQELILFAHRLRKALDDAGVAGGVGSGLVYSSSGIPAGLSIEVAPGCADQNSECCKAVFSLAVALKDANVVSKPIHVQVNRSAPPDYIWIVVSPP